MTNSMVELVVDATANDYENLEMIAREVERWANARGIPYSENELLEALKFAIDHGYVEAFIYSEPKRDFERDAFSIAERAEFYYLATSKGKALLEG